MKIIAICVAILIIGGTGYALYMFFGKSEPATSGIPPENESQYNTYDTQNSSLGGEGSSSLESGAQELPEISMQFSIIKEGTGEGAKKGDLVTVHYTGWLTDDTKFDSSVDRGVPFKFILGTGEVIPGWDAGVEGMKVGEVRKLIIPPELAYREQGIPGAIPPNATLVFMVEMLAINK